MLVEIYKSTVTQGVMGRSSTRRKPGDLPDVILLLTVFGGGTTMKRLVTIIAFFLYFCAVAQETPVNLLDEVQLYSHFSKKYLVSNTNSILSDSILKKENTNLTNLLRKYSNVYFKEQGRGMVSSIAMRGSSAAHTAVYWNGIPVNSSLNGQTDFNTIFVSNYNSISIRKGGGSVLLGSGAIGGAINLKNDLQFQNETTGLLKTSLGSYQSYATSVSLNHSNAKVAFQMGFSGFSSKNNYKYADSELENENGEIKHYTLHLNAGVKLNNKSSLYIKGLYNNSDRNTSGTLYSNNNANLGYKNINTVLGWKYKNLKYHSELKTAFLQEDYKYIFSKDAPNYFSDNGSRKWFANYDANYKLNSKIQFQLGVSYELLHGKGTDIQESERKNLGIYWSVHHKLIDKVTYNINVRKEWSSVYKIPFVFSLNTKQQWYKQHATSISVSSNFRVPTLNDLYWYPLGNPNLQPEKNWAIDLGYEWRHTNFELGLNAYKSNSSNLIQWRPQTGNIWRPINIQKVVSKGLEFNFETSYKIKGHKISNHIQYSYTETKDEKLKKQLIYVPFHIGNLQLSYAVDNWIIAINEQYNGKVFTTSSNTLSSRIDDYWLMNTSVKRSLLHDKMTIGFDINNLFNKDYQIVSSRPMPKRNFNLIINYKF